MCRILLGALFAGAGAGADGSAVEEHLHQEALVVIRALLTDELVAELLVFLLLSSLLLSAQVL